MSCWSLLSSAFCILLPVAKQQVLYKQHVHVFSGEVLWAFVHVFLLYFCSCTDTTASKCLPSVTFTCTADLGAILWIQGSHQQHYSSSSTVNDTGSLGAFTVRLVSVDGSNYTSTSTATIANTTTLLSIMGSITLTCDDNGDAVGGDTAVLVVVNVECPTSKCACAKF